MTLLFVNIPESYILIIVLEIERSNAMLVILEPFSLIFFTIGKSISTLSLTFAFGL